MMAAQPKRVGFWQGALVALVISALGSVLHVLLDPVLSAGFELRLLITTLALVYVSWLLSVSGLRSGRLSALLIWLALASGLWWLAPSHELYLFAHLGLLWLLRSLLSYRSVLAAVADLLLTGVSLLAAIWAAQHSGSLLLTLWTFFLLQALSALIPTTLRRQRQAPQAATGDAHFERAHRAAEVALQQLSRQP